MVGGVRLMTYCTSAAAELLNARAHRSLLDIMQFMPVSYHNRQLFAAAAWRESPGHGFDLFTAKNGKLHEFR
jgi:hypothetical protein